MMMHAPNGATLVRWMALDRDREPDSEWLLFGPTDPQVVEASTPVRREACGGRLPNTERQ